ncbi:MAG: hypothetical protein AB7T27_07805 [Kiritimatiellia bacterium]
MTKILMPCLVALACAMSPLCFARETAPESTNDAAAVQEESNEAAETAADTDDAVLRNSKAEAARAQVENTETEAGEKPVLRKARKGKTTAAETKIETEPSDKPEDELDKPVQRKAKDAESATRKYETGLAPSSTGSKWSYTLGAGIIISPDYKDMMEMTYGEVDASTIGWVDLQAGLRCKLSEAFTLTPGLDLLVNYFVPEEEDTFISHIILPSLGIQYEFQNNPAYYLGADVSYPLADSGSDSLDLSASGPGFSAFLGYMTEKEWNIEFGYSLLPVENGSEDDAEEYNLGGFILKVNRRF